MGAEGSGGATLKEYEVKDVFKVGRRLCVVLEMSWMNLLLSARESRVSNPLDFIAFLRNFDGAISLVFLLKYLYREYSTTALLTSACVPILL